MVEASEYVDDSDISDEFKATGQKRVLLLAKAECEETGENTEEVHGFKVKNNLGSPMHLKKALQSHIWHN